MANFRPKLFRNLIAGPARVLWSVQNITFAIEQVTMQRPFHQYFISSLILHIKIFPDCIDAQCLWQMHQSTATVTMVQRLHPELFSAYQFQNVIHETKSFSL